jgi:Domain of unknown function (DUF222)
MEGSTRTGTLAEPTAELSAGAAALERRAVVVDRLRESDRDVARAVAVRLERVNAFRLEAEAANSDPDASREDAAGARARVRFQVSPDIERRSVRAELAAALRISERAAETQLEMAKALVTELTSTMDALRAGEISERHARLIWEHWCQVPDADRPVFEEQALQAARKLSPARLVGKLRDLQERLHPETATERHRAAVGGRDVWLDPLADGTAILSIRDSAEKLVAAQHLIEDYARGIAADPHETRTLAQVRADVATGFLLTGELGDQTIVPTAHVVVPALSLAGVSEELAILEGYGPVDLATARTLLADAEEFIRVVTHPVTGTVLAVDSYKPTKALRRWLQIRDETCRAPGCGRRAAYCELDHTLELARDHGPTAFDNLAYLCVNHHKLKSLTGWSYRHLDRFGTLEWTTPLGEKYITEPAVKMRAGPHLDDAIRQAMLEHDQPPPEFNDRIPDDLYAQWQAEMDDELDALRAARIVLSG